MRFEVGAPAGFQEHLPQEPRGDIRGSGEDEGAGRESLALGTLGPDTLLLMQPGSGSHTCSGGRVSEGQVDPWLAALSWELQHPPFAL